MQMIKKGIFLSVGLIVWQILVSVGMINDYMFPAPIDLGRSFYALLVSGELAVDILSSVKRVCVGFALATVAGVSLGVLAGYSKKVSELLTPFFEFLRPIPPIAWIPIAILWFGFGDAPAFFLVFLGAFFPIFINTYWGIRSSKQIYVNVARNFGVGKWVTLSQVIFPASVPYICRGIHIGLGLAWTSVITAELVGAQSGLGYMIQLNRIMLKTSHIVVGMITIGVVGLCMNSILNLITRRLTFWCQDSMEVVSLQNAKGTYDHL